MLTVSWRTMRILIPLVLLVMVLMRLVWMQLRDYPASADYRALVNQTRMVDNFSDICSLNTNRSDSLMVKEFNEAKDIRNTPGYDWFLSPGYMVYARLGCQEGEFRPDNLVRLNQWLLVSVVALGSLMVRMLTRSWAFALIGAVVLLSRGHLLSLIGDVGPWAVATVIIMAWVGSMLHFFLTGSPVTLIAGVGLIAFGSSVDPVFWTLALVLPLLIAGGLIFRKSLAAPAMQRFRAEQRRLKRLIRRGKLKVYDGSVLSGLALDLVEGLVGYRGKDVLANYPKAFRRTRGLLFQTLKEPFALWVIQKRRGTKICLLLVPTALALFLGTFALQREGIGDSGWSFGWILTHTELSYLWLNTFFEDIAALMDWHLGLSMVLIFVCALQSPAAGLKGFFEISWLIIVAYVVATLGAVAYDYVDFQIVRRLESSFGVWSMMVWSRSADVLIWFEPVFLVMGLAAIYNLLVIVNQHWSRRRLRS